MFNFLSKKVIQISHLKQDAFNISLIQKLSPENIVCQESKALNKPGIVAM